MRYVALTLYLAACDGSAIVDAGAGDAALDDAASDAGADACVAMCGDTDGDHIPDAVEVGDDPTMPVDTDHDGTPDVRDLDSDDDTISDRDEWNAAMPDQDGDGDDDFRDLDSDADGIADATEAGDADLATPPVECASEIYPVTRTRTYPSVGGTALPYPGDYYPDYLDLDSDNDSVPDGDELRLGTNRCAVDTDGDGAEDVFEGTYAMRHCPTEPSACGLATDPARAPPPEAELHVLPYLGPAIFRTFDVLVPASIPGPVDVTTSTHADDNPLHVDATHFVHAVVPACDPLAPMRVAPCWMEPPGVPHGAAVTSYDASTFYGVMPGTTITFSWTLRDDFYPTCFADSFVATLDAVASGHVIATRELYLVAVSDHCGAL